MIERGRISSRQASILIYIVVIGTIFLFLPRILLDMVPTGHFITIIGGLIIASLVFVFVFKMLLEKFPDDNIFQVSKIILGKYLGGLIGLMFIAGNLQIASIQVRSLGEFFITSIMPETPLSVFIIVMLILVTMTASAGIEAIGRMAEFWIGVLVLSFFFIFIGALPELEIGRIQPLIRTQDLPSVFLATIKMSTVYMQAMVIIFFFSYINDKKYVLRDSLISLSLAGLALLITYILVVSLFSKDLVRHFVWPTLEMTRNITVAGFFERIEVFFVIVWILMAYIKLSVFVYGASIGVAQIFNFKSHRWNPYLLAIPIYFLAFRPDNMPTVLRLVQAWEFGVRPAIFTLLIPSILIIVALIRGKGGTKDAAKKDSSSSDN